MTARHALVPTDLGDVTAVAVDEAVVGAYFAGQRHLPGEESFGERVVPSEDDVLRAFAAQLTAYFAGDLTDFDLPLAPVGDAFHQQVWAMLCDIPYGATTTYGALAEALGDKHLAQAVGQAVGHNPISVVIPCHRVVGSDGRLTGYAGGLDRKRHLLRLEEPAEAAAGRLF